MDVGETCRRGGTTFGGGGPTLNRFASGYISSGNGLHVLSLSPYAARGSANANAKMHATRANLIYFSSLPSAFNVCH